MKIEEIATKIHDIDNDITKEYSEVKKLTSEILEKMEKVKENIEEDISLLKEILETNETSMPEEIWIRPYMKMDHRYILDWAYEDPSPTDFCVKYEKVEVDEELLRDMMNVNWDNFGYFVRYFETKDEIIEALKNRDVTDIDNIPIEFKGPGYYTYWENKGVILNAFKALEVEYDLAWEKGKWPARLTTADDDRECLRYFSPDPGDVETFLYDIYGCQGTWWRDTDECYRCLQDWVKEKYLEYGFPDSDYIWNKNLRIKRLLTVLSVMLRRLVGLTRPEYPNSFFLS